MTLLEVSGLTKTYPTRRDPLGRVRSRFHAVDDVSFELREAETLAVVGESGAGKSTLGRLVLRLIEPDAGVIRLEQDDLRAFGGRELRRHRARMQMIFQDPYSSLDPKMTIADSVAEPIKIHRKLKGDERRDTVRELLVRVGLREDQLDRYPYELSGGQLQRVAVAKALAPEPRLIVCDEPVAALDVSIRAQVINLLRDLQAERGLSYLFISHDLSLVRTIAHRVAVMFAGRIVELGPSEEIFERPRHPYTRTLLAAIPEADPRRRKLDPGRAIEAAVDTVSLMDWHGRCAYCDRCPEVFAPCRQTDPPLAPVTESTEVACHLFVGSRSADEVTAQPSPDPS